MYYCETEPRRLSQLPATKPVRSADPTFEPITLAEAKQQVRLADEVSYHDELLTHLVKAARETVEHDTGLALATGTFTWKLTDWPAEDYLEIKGVRPVTSVTSIAYLGTSGASQTWSASEYTLETSTVTPMVRLNYSYSWPTLRGDINGITLTLVAGYATAAAVPYMAKQAVRLLVSHWFDNNGIVGNVGPDIGETYNALIGRLMRSSYP